MNQVTIIVYHDYNESLVSGNSRSVVNVLDFETIKLWIDLRLSSYNKKTTSLFESQHTLDVSGLLCLFTEQLNKWFV